MEKLSASLEDYLEAIYHIIDESQVARSKDIADRLGVARPSVTGALKVLSEKGLVNYKPYGFVTLTDKGMKRATVICNKHKVIESFFVDILDVDVVTAERVACEVEHSVGPKIVSRLASLAEFVKSNDDGIFFEKFKKFHEKNIQS